MEFYRYEDVDDIAGIGPKVKLRKFNLLRETLKGYWIMPAFISYYEGHKHWVSKTSRKRYAYPTKEGAAVNFFKRKQLQIAILSNRLERAKQALSQADTILKEEIE